MTITQPSIPSLSAEEAVSAKDAHAQETMHGTVMVALASGRGWWKCQGCEAGGGAVPLVYQAIHE